MRLGLKLLWDGHQIQMFWVFPLNFTFNSGRGVALGCGASSGRRRPIQPHNLATLGNFISGKVSPTDCLRCAFAVRITVCRLSTMPQKNAGQYIHNHIHLDSAQHSTQPDYKYYVYTISLYMQHYFVILLLFMIDPRYAVRGMIDHAPVNLIIGRA